jgi:hypothetical protein
MKGWMKPDDHVTKILDICGGFRFQPAMKPSSGSRRVGRAWIRHWHLWDFDDVSNSFSRC